MDEYAFGFDSESLTVLGAGVLRNIPRFIDMGGDDDDDDVGRCIYLYGGNAQMMTTMMMPNHLH